jgi:hypothetical protein
MLRGAGAWTTDRVQLNITRSRLGLEPTRDDLAAWESAELLLVTVPKWFDLATDYPAKVVHAGPRGVTRGSQEATTADGRPRILLSFSTTVMQGQVALIQRVCDALAGQAVDAVLTLGPALNAEAINAPRNLETVAYADHDQLLPQTDAVITHGGLGTTLRALAHGKPCSCFRSDATSSSTPRGSSSSVLAFAFRSSARPRKSPPPSSNCSPNHRSGRPRRTPLRRSHATSRTKRLSRR